MNRRNFFKLLGKGAAATVAVVTVGLPEVETDVETQPDSDGEIWAKADDNLGGFEVPEEVGKQLLNDAAFDVSEFLSNIQPIEIEAELIYS